CADQGKIVALERFFVIVCSGYCVIIFKAGCGLPKRVLSGSIATPLLGLRPNSSAKKALIGASGSVNQINLPPLQIYWCNKAFSKGKKSCCGLTIASNAVFCGIV